MSKFLEKFAQETFVLILKVFNSTSEVLPGAIPHSTAGFQANRTAGGSAWRIVCAPRRHA